MRRTEKINEKSTFGPGGLEETTALSPLLFTPAMPTQQSAGGHPQQPTLLMTLLDSNPRPRVQPITLKVHTPLMSVETARACLADASEDDVLRMIESRELEWAWDIAGKGSRRRQLRILSECVAQRQNGHATKLPFEEVMQLIFGAPRYYVTGKEIYAALNCCSTHGMNLLHDGALQCLPRSEWRTGPKGSPHVLWTSLAEFMKERREPNYRWTKE